VTFRSLQLAPEQPPPEQLIQRIFELAGLAGSFVEASRHGKLDEPGELSRHLAGLLRTLLAAASALDIDVDTAARRNLVKVYSRWPLPEGKAYPPPTDLGMLTNERIPRQFEIFIEEHRVGDKTYVLQKRNGVIIGDRLTDNKAKADDYRFHDVFHIAYAVHLEWSPVLRKLFGVKRRSVPSIDHNEDGARAILIEEGIATLVFNHALELTPRFFKDLNHVSYDLLKVIQEFVRGYEVERCSLWQWQTAILDGFRMFRDLTEHRRGYIVADLDAHTLTFVPGSDRDDSYYTRSFSDPG
jgi:hypothetical protein